MKTKNVIAVVMSLIIAVISPLQTVAGAEENGCVEADVIQVWDNYLEIVQDDDNIVVINQYDSDHNLLYTVKGDRINKVINEYDIVNNDEHSLVIDSAFMNISDIKDVQSNSINATNETAYTNIGYMVAQLNGEIGQRTMKVTYRYENTGDTTGVTYSKHSESLANFITSVAVGLAVSAAIANTIIGSLVSAALCAIAGSVISVLSTISLSCKMYRCYFCTYDMNDSRYNAEHAYGYMYLVSDSKHSNFNNKQFYEGVTTDSVKNGDFNSCQTLLNATYGKTGVIDYSASTVFN